MPAFLLTFAVCPASGCPTTTAAATTITPQNNTVATTTNPNDDGNSMLFVYIALGVFLFALFVLCLILAVILCRRCSAVRRMKADEANQERIEDGASGRHAYKQFSDEEQSMRGDADDMSTMSVRSMNLRLRSDGNDGSGYDSKSSNLSTPDMSMKSETLPMVTLNSSSVPKDNDQSVHGSPLVHRSASVPEAYNNSLSSHGRLPPDGMSSGVSDEAKGNNSDRTSQQQNPPSNDKQSGHSFGLAPNDALNNSFNHSRLASTKAPRNSPVPVTPHRAASTPNSATITSSNAPNAVIPPTTSQSEAIPPRSDTEPSFNRVSSAAASSAAPSQSKNAFAAKHSSAPTLSQNSPTVGRGPTEIPSTRLPGSAAGPQPVPSQKADTPKMSSARVHPIAHNSHGKVSQAVKQPSSTPPSATNPADVSRMQKSPLQIRKAKPPRDIKGLDPRTLFTNNNPNLKYAGFGEFDEINGSLV